MSLHKNSMLGIKIECKNKYFEEAYKMICESFIYDSKKLIELSKLKH